MSILFGAEGAKNVRELYVGAEGGPRRVKEGYLGVDGAARLFYTSAPRVYGVEWDGSAASAWTRTDDAERLEAPRPALGGGAGGSPFDKLQPWAGLVKEERAGGTMVRIPRFWYKLARSGKGLKLQIAAQPVEGFSVSPAHMDRGDGGGQREAVYVGRYHCAQGTFKSTAGAAPASRHTRAVGRESCRQVGEGYYQMDLAMRFTLWLLYLVEFADWNSQAAIGMGGSSGGAREANGQTDGLTYHTGTTQSTREAGGFTQYRWIEGLWDNVYDWCDGCYNNRNGLNVILNPQNFSESTGGRVIGKPANGWPAALTVGSTGGFPAFYPSAAGGSESTYTCDYWSYSTSNPCVYVGGSERAYGQHGLFYVAYDAASYASDDVGSRLMELP